ncbi:hypothetical protein [Nonomuraea sp. SBT364]|uniref:hypothetical protein n=1 Tax=Nonomuraea sp. SBT364 TaxID=1580530 RepID=UPI00066E53AF|nr:hypothetical protein [Nonomuraea sp. SBT364]
MANDVEIVITAKDKSGPAFAAARTKQRAFAADTKATLGKAGQDAGRALGDGIVEGADGRLRDARGRFVKGGQDLGGGISDGIKDGTERGGRFVSGFAASTLKTFGRLGPAAGALLTAGLVGAAASAGTVAGGITLAAGAALTGIGVASAVQSQAVRRDWAQTAREVRSELAEVAQPMEDSASRAATVTRNTFGRLKPFLARFFEDSQPSVDRFVRSIGDGVASLGPALGPLERGYSAVLDRISARSPEIFGALERSLSNLGATAEEHADDIAGALEFVARTAEATTVAIDYLADSWSDLTGDIEAANDAGESAGVSFGRWMHSVAESMGINTEQMKKQKAQWDALDAAAANPDGVQKAAEATGVLGGKAADTTVGLRDLATAMDELNGAALDAADAQIGVEEAIDRAAESVRKNGRTLNVNTEAGRANRSALLDLARAAQKHISSMQAEGASTEEIAGKYQRYRDQLVSTLQAAGRTRAEARALADQWLATPEQVTTHVEADLTDLKSRLKEAKNRLNDPNLTRPERTRIRGEISDLQAKVAAAKRALASIQGKTVTIRSNYVTTHTYQSGTASLRELLPGFGRASGGISGGGRGLRKMATGGIGGGTPVMVGEQGPELVNLPFGSSVSPAGQTRARMMGGGGFGSISMAFRQGQQGGSSRGGLDGIVDSLREVLSFREALEKLSSTLIGQTRAVSAYEAAWDAAGRSLKENGKRLSLTSEKGRENRGALLDLADAAREVVIAMQEQGRSSSTLLSTMKEQRNEFITMARRMGLSKKDAGAMADRMGLTTAGVRSALAGGKAGGGPAGGWTLVGERGPELARLPFGSSVVPAGQSAAMMAAGGTSPAPVVLELRSSGSAVDDLLLKILRGAIRTRGGNVQLVLGRT